MVGSCIGIMVLAFLFEGLRLLKMKVGERGRRPRCYVDPVSYSTGKNDENPKSYGAAQPSNDQIAEPNGQVYILLLIINLKRFL